MQVFSATERTYFGLPGLASDTITVRDKLRQRVNLYAMKEERTIEPETFCHLVSSTLYERRYVQALFSPDLAGTLSERSPSCVTRRRIRISPDSARPTGSVPISSSRSSQVRRLERRCGTSKALILLCAQV